MCIKTISIILVKYLSLLLVDIWLKVILNLNVCTYDRVLFTHRVEEGGGTWIRGAVYTKNTIIKRTILIDRYTQMARGER